MNKKPKTRKQLSDAYDRFAAENRKLVARGGSAKGLAKYDQLTARQKDRTISSTKRNDPNSGYNKIASEERARNRRAIRTGGQW